MHAREQAGLLRAANFYYIALVERHAGAAIGRKSGGMAAAQPQANYCVFVQHQRGNIRKVRGNWHQHQRVRSRVDNRAAMDAACGKSTAAR